ncbi:hypothetical protein BCR34DRAFT_564684 [Clohesyomyces aquaticus]|uniref:RapZ C-terminal domain-containing protein n=1 Tax=Clohesyomyces aquaticus TaxID=1231657 RepID=A0A1Y1ZNK2_9PLEO|nr:hypothetical protein BCR34DRAFT_564684 [Clohesyomyces aquaticus]
MYQPHSNTDKVVRFHHVDMDPAGTAKQNQPRLPTSSTDAGGRPLRHVHFSTDPQPNKQRVHFSGKDMDRPNDIQPYPRDRPRISEYSYADNTHSRRRYSNPPQPSTRRARTPAPDHRHLPHQPRPPTHEDRRSISPTTRRYPSIPVPAPIPRPPLQLQLPTSHHQRTRSFHPLPSTSISTLTLASPRPAIYLLSYSRAHCPDSRYPDLLASLLPHGIRHLYTIHCKHFDKPPKDMWHEFSGTHPVIQEFVLMDQRASEAVARGVEDVIRAVRGLEGRRRDGGRGSGDVALSACCGAGTHRSVAVIERIARELRRLGYRDLRVVHVHRTRKVNDPY